MHFGPATKSVNYLNMAETCGFPATVKYVIMSCYHIFTLIFVKRAQSKQQNTGCSPVATTCTYVEIAGTFLEIDFKLVSIVKCFHWRGVSKQVKVVQIPMTKADLFLGIFEAIPGTLKRFEDFFVC